MSLPLNNDLADMLRAGATAVEKDPTAATSEAARRSTEAMVARMRATADALEIDLIAEDDARMQMCLLDAILDVIGERRLTHDEVSELASSIRLSLKAIGFPPPSEPPPPPVPRRRWPNNIDWVSVEALEYLSEHPRPEGEGVEFNAKHLLRIANELRSAFLYTPLE